MGRAKKVVYEDGYWYIDDGAGGRTDVTPSGAGNLDDLDNVNTSGKSHGDILQWNSSSGKWEDAPLGTPSAHASTHENGGADEINLAGLDGEPTALTTHKSSSDHDGRYYTESEMDSLLSDKADSSHNHDDRYYTESEIDSQMSDKADASHTHDDRYYTESETDNLLSGKSDTEHTHTESDITDLDHYTTSDFNTDFASQDLANLGTKNHSDLNDDEPTKHRLINDSGAGTTELWSANKINTELGLKADTNHTHDDRYYTESEIDTQMSGKSDTGHTHTESDITDLDHYTTTDFNTDFGNQDLANLGTKNHSDLNDDEPEKHRLINDSGSGSTDLWSANKIDTELAGKVDSPIPAALYMDSIGDQILTGGPVIINLDTTVVAASFSSLGANEIIFTAEGTYLIGHKLIYDITDTAGGTRGRVEAWLELDTGGGYNEITGSRAGVYHREEAGGSGLSCPMIPVSVGDGHKIRYMANVTYANTNVDTKAGTPIVTIMKIS